MTKTKTPEEHRRESAVLRTRVLLSPVLAFAKCKDQLAEIRKDLPPGKQQALTDVLKAIDDLDLAGRKLLQ